MEVFQIDFKILETVTIFIAEISSFFTSLGVELQGLLMLMAIDFITGVLVAAVFRNSNKTKTGAYDSTKGFVGIAKKVFIILLLVALHFVDRVMGAGGLALKLGTVGFMINEFMSIMENAGLMGIKLPKAFSNALDVLKSKEDDEK